MKMNLQKLRMQNAERLYTKRKNGLVPPLTPPRYDEVYFEGLKWLDSLAGEKNSFWSCHKTMRRGLPALAGSGMRPPLICS